jgi:signal transduction histidine kinase
MTRNEGPSVQRWIAYWQAVSDSGCQPTGTQPERKRIRLTNQSSIILTVLIFLYAVVFGLYGPPSLAWITLGVALLFAAIPILQNLSHGALLVRYIFLLSSYTCIFCYSALLGRDSGIHLFFISAVAAPFIVLDVRYRASQALFCLLPLVLFFTLELHVYDHFQPLPFSAEARRLIYLMMLPSAALTTFLYSGYFHLINQKSERELNDTIQDLHRSHQLIEDQQLQLASASRLTAIGELSGSIAHEINNPLSIISGYTELIIRFMRNETVDRERVLQTCDKILQTTTRINKTVLGLRKLAREGANDPMEMADLKDAVEDAIAICSESLHHDGIELRLKFPEDNTTCLCRPLQIAQVLLNLIQNARDAVQSLDTKWIEIEIKQEPDAYLLLVKDSGVIKDPDLLNRIGQPFFTTKPAGKGTGLGLSISRKIMSSHGGSIELDKKASSTTFVMKLPRRAQTSP